MKKLFALTLGLVLMVAACAFCSGMVFARATNTVATTMATVAPTAMPTAMPTATPVATPTTVPTTVPTAEPTATPVATDAPQIHEDPAMISWNDFMAMSRYCDGSFNAIEAGKEYGRVSFTDVDLMVHVGEKLNVNVASLSVSVKLEGMEHSYKKATVSEPDLRVCWKHKALGRRHSKAYGDDITIELTEEDITNIATYAAYWYDGEGKLVYGLVCCCCFINEKVSGAGSSSDNGGAGDQPSSEPEKTPAAPNETPRPAPTDTPAAPIETADNKPSHNEEPKEPEVAVANTPAVPAQDYVGKNEPAHNEQPKTTDGAQDGAASGTPNHSDLVAEESTNEVPSAPAENVVASIPSAPAEDFVASISSASVVEENTVNDDATNIPSFSDMPTE